MNLRFKILNILSFILPYVMVGTSVVFCNSCVEIIQVSDDFYSDEVVINSIFEPDSLLQVNVSLSNSPFGSVAFNYVDNSEVYISEAGAEGELCEYRDAGWYASSGMIVNAGMSYELRVNTPGFDEVSSSVIVPSKPIVDTVFLQNDSVYAVIDDDASIDQYYLFIFKANVNDNDCFYLPDSSYTCGDIVRYRYVDMESDDAAIDAYIDERYAHVNNMSGLTLDDDLWDLEPDFEAGGFLVSDASFSGEQREFSFKVSYRTKRWMADSILDMHIYAVDYNYYQYLLSFAQFCTTGDTPFTDRARVHSNIDGGYGLLGSRNGLKVQLNCSDILLTE